MKADGPGRSDNAGASTRRTPVAFPSAPTDRTTSLMPISMLDPLDLQIIRELQDDGRRAFREIARNLDVPEATVRTRVKRLQDQGVLQILAFTNPSKLGHAKLALFFAEVDPGEHERVVATLESWSEVSYLSTTTGSADLCVQVFCRDDEGQWVLQQRVRSLPGVRSVRMMQEIKVHKIRFSIPDNDAGESEGDGDE
jgi:Lrp/AsnC family transcriptional regulator for asnA, asnC and gidA